MARPITLTYFKYLRYGSILCCPSLLIMEYFFNLRETGLMLLCKNPIGQAQPHTALPDTTPIAPKIANG